MDFNRKEIKKLIQKSGGVDVCSAITGYSPIYIKKVRSGATPLTVEFFARFCYLLGVKLPIEEIGKLFLINLGVMEG